MYYVYLLYSRAMISITWDRLRIWKLALGFIMSCPKHPTRAISPWELRFSLEVADRKLAMQVESYIKGRKSKTYLEKLTNDEEVVLRLKKRFGLAG
jgi:hypothetical protein